MNSASEPGTRRRAAPATLALETVGEPAVHPGIRDVSAGVFVQGDLVRHRNRAVGFVVDEAGHRRNRAAWNELLDEDHRTAERSVAMATAHVESEVDLLERAMARNPDSLDSGVDEAEPDKADEIHVMPGVELGAPRHEWLENLSGALEVEENQTLPSRRQEGLCHVRRGTCPLQLRPAPGLRTQVSPRSLAPALSDHQPQLSHNECLHALQAAGSRDVIRQLGDLLVRFDESDEGSPITDREPYLTTGSRISR